MPKQKLSCWDAALHMLARRDHARAELAGKLTRKQYNNIDIATTLNRLEQEGLVNDAKFAEHRTRYRAEISHWGPHRIKQELKQMGVAEDFIEAGLLTLQTPETPFQQPHAFDESALDILERRFGPWPKHLTTPPKEFDAQHQFQKAVEKEKARRLNFLLRKGFSHQQALKAFEALRSQES